MRQGCAGDCAIFIFQLLHGAKRAREGRSLMNPVLERVGRALASFLSRERHVHGVTPPTPPDRLLSCLEPAVVLLVEGSSLISTAFNYPTAVRVAKCSASIRATG